MVIADDKNDLTTEKPQGAKMSPLYFRMGRNHRKDNNESMTLTMVSLYLLPREGNGEEWSRIWGLADANIYI